MEQTPHYNQQADDHAKSSHNNINNIFSHSLR